MPTATLGIHFFFFFSSRSLTLYYVCFIYVLVWIM
jgi:hypothetical protein